ncbi:hypothetical protein DAEQUDRAFT_719899 [Daedalea quercina L-15889]|uniref:Uncharacterized protein n=1 Tax=Daedalea quercina L-15889 TaxID=1314783 RepID=A0A165UCR9_9APHY|nr:hypothetical protein DAEQUDRAFT_719899 [Daedalea quercina L-15889]
MATMAPQNMQQDSALTNEIVLAMASELQRLREQLNEPTDVSKGSNASEIQGLRNENARLQKELNGGLPLTMSEHGKQVPTYDSLQCQLNLVLRTQDEERVLHAKLVEGLKAELVTVKKQTRAALETGQGLTGVQQRLFSASAESSADTDSETITEDDFSPGNFLDTRGEQEDEGPALDLYESHAGLNLWAAVRKELPDASILDGALHISPDSVIWHHDHRGARRCLLFYPSQRFNLCDKGNWKSEGCVQIIEKGDIRELFCKAGKALSYCGTYKCAGIASLSEEEVKQFSPRHTLMNAVMQRTTSYAKVEIPTHVGKLIREMYRSGALSLRCYGMELVERVEALDAALEKCAIRQSDSKRNSDDGEGGPRKKQKSS